MHPALWISKTGLDAQQTQIGVISNNLANANTTGYKRSRVVFEDLLYQTIRQPGADASSSTQLPTGLMLGTGVRVAATQKLFQDGSVMQTDNPLDVSIKGRGFFAVTLPDGTTGYTRNGQFHLDSTGGLVTASGDALSPAITIPTGALSITIGSDGTVSVVTTAGGAPSAVGNITISDFVNPAGLQPTGDNIYLETAASGTATAAAPGSSGLGSLVQGALEGSNVNAVEELVKMIETQRAYEMNAKSISAVADMLQFASQTL